MYFDHCVDGRDLAGRHGEAAGPSSPETEGLQRCVAGVEHVLVVVAQARDVADGLGHVAHVEQALDVGCCALAFDHHVHAGVHLGFDLEVLIFKRAQQHEAGADVSHVVHPDVPGLAVAALSHLDCSGLG